MTDAGVLRERLGVLRDSLREDLEAVADLRAVRARRAAIDTLLLDLDRQLDRVGRAAVITLVGATGAGKSTLINALAGSRIAEEGIDRPTTRHAVVYAPEDADLRDLLAAGRELGREPEVVRHAAAGAWAGEVLIDAPDLNGVDERHRAVVAALADQSDALLVVLHHQSVVETASASFVDEFAGRRRLLFALNRIDELTEAARDAVLEQVRELAATRWGAPHAPIVAISAKGAQTDPRSDGWTGLCAHLRALVREGEIGGVRRTNAVGVAVRIAALAQAIDSDVGQDLDALADEVSRGLEVLGSRVADDAEARLRLRRADLNELLAVEAAKRWDGPGGFALRSGGLMSLGMLGGAVLARRSPIVAVGAATGGLAADRVQQGLRERRVADGGALVPAAGEIASWYAEGLSAARVRASRLTGEPESLGVPSLDLARAAAADGVEEAWGLLVERDLPALAERGALRFFRFPLDLPVFALVGWVVFSSGRGLATGAYVGVDFLLDVGVLLAAYLLAVRTVVRRGLGRSVRRLLEATIARSREALALQGERIRQAVEGAVATRRAALGRLGTAGESWRNQLDPSDDGSVGP